MTPTLPLGHETCRRAHVESLKAEWRLRVIYEKNSTVSMQVSFFIYALKHGTSQDPDNRDGEQLVLIRLCGMCSAWHIPIIGITPMHLL
jgi:hypothetical protein